MTKFIISRYEHNISWVHDYTDDYVLYDRSSVPLENAIVVPNIGSDICDKLSFIIDNYDSLPDVAVYIKANLFDYIKPKEFEKIKDNKTFTPILSKFHKETTIDLSLINPEEVDPIARRLVAPPFKRPYSFYDQDGMYNELNVFGYINSVQCKSRESVVELGKLLGVMELDYVKFAPGSNYILPKENILKHPKEFYEKLRSFIDWAVYPGEAMLIERGLYTIWS